MPYIKQSKRKELKQGTKPRTAGELNYLITEVVAEYLGARPDYQLFNDVLGALEGCKLEAYRRLIAPYERGKIDANGDVYSKELVNYVVMG